MMKTTAKHNFDGEDNNEWHKSVTGYLHR